MAIKLKRHNMSNIGGYEITIILVFIIVVIPLIVGVYIEVM